MGRPWYAFGVRRLLLAVLCAACTPRGGAAVETPEPSLPQRSALEIHDELEALIAEGRDREQDRSEALAQASGLPDDGSAGYAFVRAALAGRVAENRGAKAGKLVTEAEAWARKSIERDPAFRERAATQMLGSLYVMAPGRLLEHGDSETGLELLEGLVAADPQQLRYRLRLAQAYVHLGDEEPAHEHACACLAAPDRLRADERKLLDGIVTDLGGAEALGCKAG
jgi:hypothetical protein